MNTIAVLISADIKGIMISDLICTSLLAVAMVL
jgi:hypothetical protein